MLAFSTELPLAGTVPTSALVALFRKWLIGSPHYGFTEANLGSPPDDGISSFAVGTETADLARLTTETHEVVGVRHQRLEDETLEWTTEIVGAKRHDGSAFHVAIRLHCEALGTVPEMPRARKPYIVKQIISELAAGKDGSLDVSDKPRVLRDSELDLAVALMRGDHGNALPVVYVSVDDQDHPVVDVDQLSTWLSGLAHVVVEPRRTFSFKLMQSVGRANAYGGAVGVYWPEGEALPLRFLRRSFPNATEMQREIARRVTEAVSHRRVAPVCTWNVLREEASRREVQRLRDTGSTKVDDYVRLFDAEIAAAKKQVVDAEIEIARLRAEVARTQRQSNTADDEGLLRDGKESDFFEGERRAVVVAALSEALKSVPDDSRRAHVLRDLIDANEPDDDEEDPLEVRAGRVKSLFRGYESLGAKDRREVESLGFEVSDDGKHHKLVFMGDGRYTFALSKTSSDHRAGLNFASTVIRKVF